MCRAVRLGALTVAAGFPVGAPVSRRRHLRAQGAVAMETGAGGEEGGAEELDGAEGRAAGNEVHLVFVGTGEERETFGFAGPEDAERADQNRASPEEIRGSEILTPTRQTL